MIPVLLGRGEITRKHISDMYFNAEMEAEMRVTRKLGWKFHMDSDRELFFELLEIERVSRLYQHTPSPLCSEKGTISWQMCLLLQDVENAGP